MAHISIVSIGPGREDFILPVAQERMQNADVVVGYEYYFSLIEHLIGGDAARVGKVLSEEQDRANAAIEEASQGKKVVVLSSGDAGIYAIGAYVYEELNKSEYKDQIEIETIPGISAFQAAAARLGAPVGHDFCTISLSDLMTPWATIEQRILAAATGDFVTCIYNPKSLNRYWQLYYLKEIFLKYRSKETPAAICSNVTREDEKVIITTIQDFDPEEVDMFSLVIFGSAQTYTINDHIITPRGAHFKNIENTETITGETVQAEGFHTIQNELSLARKKEESIGKWNISNYTRGDFWAILHCIHQTADFEYKDLYYSYNKPVEKWHKLFKSGCTIITDDPMVNAGVKQHLLSKYDIKISCFGEEEEAYELAKKENITASQAGMRLAIEKHEDALFVFGHAPSALVELTDSLRDEDWRPQGVIAAPVGFINVIEAKLRLKTYSSFPYILINGRKGGCNVAASILNSILSLEQAEDLITDEFRELI